MEGISEMLHLQEFPTIQYINVSSLDQQVPLKKADMVLLLGRSWNTGDINWYAVYVVWAGVCPELLSSGETRRGIKEMSPSRKGTMKGQKIVLKIIFLIYYSLAFCRYPWRPVWFSHLLYEKNDTESLCQVSNEYFNCLLIITIFILQFNFIGRRIKGSSILCRGYQAGSKSMPCWTGGFVTQHLYM